MKLINLIFICFTVNFTAFSQIAEKRLALVIGNSDYTEGPLNNPVNDALKVAETLKELNFEVILDTNLETRSSFIKSVRKFGSVRKDYEMGFIYYAGHGIQIGSENYLLPTKESFNTEDDVMDFGVNVSNLMRYLNETSNQINVLVLDACRDNPFENKWNQTRSLKSKGLAKIPPPTGSLIAFSTDAGSTAADGDGKNSIYCNSLCKNMQISDISIDQVFRNVRSEVLLSTNSRQRPVESSQLVGGTFYFVEPDLKKSLEKIKSLIISNEYERAIELCEYLIKYFPNNPSVHTLKAHINCLLNNKESALLDYEHALKIDPYHFEAYFTQIDLNGVIQDCGLINSVNDKTKLRTVFDSWVKSDSSNIIAFQEMARFYNWQLFKPDSAILFLKKAEDILIDQSKDVSKYFDHYISPPAVEINKNYLAASIYINFVYVYSLSENYSDGISYVNKALNQNVQYKLVNGWIYYAKGEIEESMGDFNSAIKSFTNSNRNMPQSEAPLQRLARLYDFLNNKEKALFYYDESIRLTQSGKSSDDEINHALYFKSLHYLMNKNLYLSLEILISLEERKFEIESLHLIKSIIYKELGVNHLALRDFKKYLSNFCENLNKKEFDSKFIDSCLNENYFENLPDESFYLTSIPYNKKVIDNFQPFWLNHESLKIEFINYFETF